ncbi:hypothetical protein WJX75_000426 [Coccomyxa subellipsoidea]|uniref:Mediator complex subunit Med12 domain-containing protein n=1 Tax=Coccomyxa subellipsoidea TaxID=248742 RepID=A0ABR2YXB0_9CHLO
MASYEHKPLSASLGPPAVYPVNEDAEVHVLSAEAVQNGYKESFEASLGISEAKEVDLSLAHRRELWEGTHGGNLQQRIWQQLQAAQAAQAEKLRSGRAYDVALGDADVSADVGADSAGFPKPPRDFRPPPGLGEIAVRTAYARLRAVQSRWSLEPQQQWFKELARDTPLQKLAQSMFPAHPADPANLTWLAEFQVPPLRAAWYIRIHTIHRGEWHKGTDRAAVRAKLWTADLLRALDGQLDLALPYSPPGSSPPPQPSTPPMQDSTASAGTEHVPSQHASGIWLSAGDRPWVVPDLAAAFPPETGSRWHYYLCLTGYTHREGLVDADMLVTWLLQHLGRARRSPAVTVCLVPLLQLCIQEVVQSQLHVRQLLDICCRHLAAAGAALSGDYTSMRSQAKAKLGVGMSLALRYIIIHCPQSLVALDLKPVQIALDASAHIEDHTGAGMSTAAAQRALSAVSEQAAGLGAAVNSRVLSYDEAAAVQVLEDALPLSGAAQALQALHGRMGRCNPSADFPPLVVHLVCNWACAPSLPSLLPGATDCGESRQLPSQLPLRRLFALDIMRQLAAHLRRQRGPEAAAQLPAGAPDPVLQEAVLEWLGEARTEALQAAAAELVVDLAVAGFFCPARYLNTLLARGLLDEQAERAARHRAFLRHLHPQLHLPTLSPPLPPTRSAKQSLPKADSSSQLSGSLSASSEAAPPLRNMPSESLSGQPSAAAASAPERAPKKTKSRQLPVTTGERWSAARVEYARARAVVLRGIGASRKRASSRKRGRASSEEGTSGSPPLESGRGRGAGSKRRRSGQGGDMGAAGMPDQTGDPWLDWADGSGARPAPQRAKRARHSSAEKSKSPSPDAAAASSDEGRGAIGGRAPNSSPEAGDVCSKRLRFRNVKKLVVHAMGLAPLPPNASPTPDCEVLDAILQMRPWERRCLARWLANELRVMLMWDGKSSGGRDWHRSEGWLLRGLALIEAAGGLTEAAALLVLLIARMLRLRRLALPSTKAVPGGTVVADRVWQETGLGECSLLAALSVRCCNFAAMGCLAKLLSATTAWAFANTGSPLAREEGLLCFGEAVNFAAALLCAYRSNPGVAQWWATLQKTQAQHWLTGLLSARLSSASVDKDAAQVEEAAGQLASLMGPTGTPDRSISTVEPLELQAVCTALLASYLRIPAPDHQGSEGAGSDEQREVHMRCLGHTVYLMRRRGFGSCPAWLQRCLCTALTLLQVEDAAQSESAVIFAAQCVVRGFMEMRCLLSHLPALRAALGSSLLAKLLTTACAQAASGSGVELEVGMLDVHQACLSFQVVWSAVGEQLVGWAESGEQQEAANLVAILQHAPVQAALLSRPRQLYEQLTAYPVQNPDVYAPLAVAGALVSGDLKEDLASVDGNEDCIRRVLQQASAENAEVCWLLLRCLLDAQLMAAARKRMDARRAREAAGRAFAEANAGMARTSEAEKTFTSQVLATLLKQPGKGALIARLTWALGRGIGEYLLQQTDWVLQDLSSLLGHMSLAEVLLKRCGLPAAGSDSASLSPAAKSVGGGFADMALTGLALSDQSRQRDFAQQIVRQLQTLGDMLKPVKQGADAASEPPSTPAAAADGLQSRASGEGADGTSARNSKGFGGGFGSGKVRRMSAPIGKNRQTVGSAEGVCAAVAVRMQILLPLLPVVYADREADRAKNLRYQLARALLPILASPLVYGTFRESKECGNAVMRDEQTGPLFQQLQAVMHALLAPEWAIWLRGNQEKLRDVPAYEDSASLHADIESLRPPAWLRDVLHNGHGRMKAAGKVDPWFLDGGFAACRVAAGQGKAPQWLRGAVRRRPA